MRIQRLALEDFRNYERVDVTFAEGLNLIVGRNAQGKTNLLEAIYRLGGLGSPRSADAALVRDGTERALLHGEVLRGARKLRIDLELRPGRGTRALVNRTPVSASRSLSEYAVSVFFGPDELSLVKGSPDGRRRFLDDLITKLRPARHALRVEWERISKQRNALLKSAPGRAAPASTLETLEVWDEAFVRVGSELAVARIDALGHMIPFAVKRYESIAGGGRLELAYTSRWLDEDRCAETLAHPSALDPAWVEASLRDAVADARPKELERGVSLVGPQRDDISVSLQATAGLLDARTFASQGDQRSAALALKLGEFDLLTEALGEEPILLLDDVFSELDPSRRAWLADSVRPVGQAVLTSAEPGAAEAAGAERVFEVVEGSVSVRD